MREVADLAGVAMSSVSRVLSGHPDVSPAMQQRVMAAVDSLGYQPDLLAQSLRRRETLSVGLLLCDLSDPSQAQIAAGAEGVLQAQDYALLLASSEHEPGLDTSHIRRFQQRRVDGLLLSPAAEDDPQTLALLDAAETPIVLIDRELRGDVGRRASAVLSDHRTGMRDAVGHLLDLGHRRVGMILGPALRCSHERLEERRRPTRRAACRRPTPSSRVGAGRATAATRRGRCSTPTSRRPRSSPAASSCSTARWRRSGSAACASAATCRSSPATRPP